MKYWNVFFYFAEGSGLTVCQSTVKIAFINPTITRLFVKGTKWIQDSGPKISATISQYCYSVLPNANHFSFGGELSSTETLLLKRVLSFLFQTGQRLMSFSIRA